MPLTVGQSFYVDHISLEWPLQSGQLSQYTSARDSENSSNTIFGKFCKLCSTIAKWPNVQQGLISKEKTQTFSTPTKYLEGEMGQSNMG